MNMLKHIYKGGIAMTLLTIAACSADTFTESLTPGDTPIVLKGTVTRAAGPSETGALQPLAKEYTNLKLSAKSGSVFYFYNEAITVGEPDNTDKNKSKLATSVRYPAGNKPIQLFAHTGELDTSTGKLKLISGTNVNVNDVLLSNGAESTTVGDEEGKGTTGSSDSNAQLLTFRHAMTKITIAADYSTDDQLQDPKPTVIKIKFDSNVVPTEGKIALTSKLSDNNTKATDLSTTGYELTLGDNYVVPTGEVLTGSIIKSLIIDDYTATDADLKGFTIAPDDPGKPFKLAPGLSYTLTLKIKRLKVVGITLKKEDWTIQSGNGNWGYTPYKVAIDFGTGGYNNNNSDANARISKVVLKHTNASGTYQYVGGVNTSNGQIDFVTLPSSVTTPSAELTADLYTTNGLLVAGIKPTKYEAPNGSTPGSLSISLGANGMNKDQSGAYYEVTTPLQFCNMMTNPGNEKYKLINNIDMNSLPLTYTPGEWPQNAELDGNGMSILHLNLSGSGLVATNNGTLKNIHIGPGTITSTASTADYTGGLCSVNNGTIEACINEADIISPDGKTAGGICGKNSGTILACLNTGNIEHGDVIGGICGENTKVDEADVIKGCINAGMLNKNATNLGGICGTSTAENSKDIVNTCYWLTGTARSVQQVNSELAIGSNRNATLTAVVNSADLAPEKLRTEAVIKINGAIKDTSWKFVYEKDPDSNTYPCVWPIPSIK